MTTYLPFDSDASRDRLVALLLDCYDYIDTMIEFGGDSGEGERLRALGDELRGLGVRHAWSEHEDGDADADADDADEAGAVPG